MLDLLWYKTVDMNGWSLTLCLSLSRSRSLSSDHSQVQLYRRKRGCTCNGYFI